MRPAVVGRPPQHAREVVRRPGPQEAVVRAPSCRGRCGTRFVGPLQGALRVLGRGRRRYGRPRGGGRGRRRGSGGGQGQTADEGAVAVAQREGGLQSHGPGVGAAELGCQAEHVAADPAAAAARHVLQVGAHGSGPTFLRAQAGAGVRSRAEAEQDCRRLRRSASPPYPSCPLQPMASEPEVNSGLIYRRGRPRGAGRPMGGLSARPGSRLASRSSRLPRSQVSQSSPGPPPSAPEPRGEPSRPGAAWARAGREGRTPALGQVLGEVGGERQDWTLG